LFLQDFEILSTAIGTWAHFHDLLAPLLFVSSWMFAVSLFHGYILVLLFSLFFPFFSFSFYPMLESFYVINGFQSFLQDATKIGLYMVTIFGKGIKFHLSFFVFRLLAFGTCKDKTHVQSF